MAVGKTFPDLVANWNLVDSDRNQTVPSVAVLVEKSYRVFCA